MREPLLLKVADDIEPQRYAWIKTVTKVHSFLPESSIVSNTILKLCRVLDSLIKGFRVRFLF